MHKYKSQEKKYMARQYSDSSQLSRCKPTQIITLTPNLSESCLLPLLSHSLNLSAEYWNITPTYTYGKSSCTHTVCCCISHFYSVPTQWFKVIALAAQLSSAGLHPHVFTASKSVRHTVCVIESSILCVGRLRHWRSDITRHKVYFLRTTC